MQVTVTWVREAVSTCDFRQLADAWLFLASVDPPAEAWRRSSISPTRRPTSWKLCVLDALLLDCNFTMRPGAGGAGKLVDMLSSLSSTVLYARVYVLLNVGTSFKYAALQHVHSQGNGRKDVAEKWLDDTSFEGHPPTASQSAGRLQAEVGIRCGEGCCCIRQKARSPSERRSGAAQEASQDSAHSTQTE